MAGRKERYNREQAIKAFFEISQKMENKANWWRWTELSIILVGMFVSIFSSLSMEVFHKEKTLEQTLKKPYMLPSMALAISLITLITFLPTFFNWAMKKKRGRDLSFKQKVVKTYLEQLDKTIINPSIKHSHE